MQSHMPRFVCPLCKFDSVNHDDIQQHKIQWHKQIEAVEETKDRTISSRPAEEIECKYTPILAVPKSASQPCKAYALENNAAISKQQESQQSGIDSIATCSIASDIQEKQAPLHGKSWGTNALLTDGDIDNGVTKSNTRIGKGKKKTTVH